MRSGNRSTVGALAFVFLSVIVASAGCVDSGTKPKSNRAVTVAKSEAAEQPAKDNESNSPVEERTEVRPETTSSSSTDLKQATQTQLDRATVEPSASESSPTQVTTLKPPVIRSATMPEVVMSAAHAADCVVRVGDEFPTFRLPDLQGQIKSLGDVQGGAMTVVVFWSGDRLLAKDQLRYLDDHIGPFADLGVRAVAIHVGNNVGDVQKAVDSLQLRTPVLLDRDRALFSRVGTNHLPRTYLLDRDGRILWFDIEFSRNTREELEQAINASLKSA